MGKGSDKGYRVYLFNNKTEEFHPVEDGFICGREGEISFPKDDLMSRRHCQFFIKGNDIYIQDLSSTNRTIVNSVPIMPLKRRRIQLHDVIEAGEQRFVLTHQNRHEPANLNDIATKKIYKALPAKGGYVVDEVSRLVTKRTRVILSAGKFRALRLKSQLGRQKARFKLLAISSFFAAAGAAAFYYFVPEASLAEFVQTLPERWSSWNSQH